MFCRNMTGRLRLVRFHGRRRTGNGHQKVFRRSVRNSGNNNVAKNSEAHAALTLRSTDELAMVDSYRYDVTYNPIPIIRALINKH